MADEGKDGGSARRLQKGVSRDYAESPAERGIKPSKPAHLMPPQPVLVPPPLNQGSKEAADKK
jgi:hypothetical protein